MVLNRRDFLGAGLKFGALAGLGELGIPSSVFGNVPSTLSGKAPLGSDIEPLARLIEDAPRDRLFALLADQIKSGVGPSPLWTAALLAGVRGIKPRPVGFKFHSVLVVNSAAIASRESKDLDRWLPLFWTLDYFKEAQAQNLSQGGWSMSALDDAKVPGAAHARRLFIDAMETWDEAKADQAVAGLYRTTSAGDVAELFWRYGMRDFRDIGHKAIFVANSWRMLATLGWRHAEPVVRSLAFALLAHDGTNPAKADLEPDRPWRSNLSRARKIRPEWLQGKTSESATHDFWGALRTADWSDACEAVVTQLNRSVSPTSLWDACFLRGGELLMQQPGIVGIHCVTSINALHFAYQQAANDETRRLALLQATAFLVMFRDMMKKNGLDEKLLLDKLERVTPTQTGLGAVGEIFADLGTSRLKAAQKSLDWLERPENRPESWIRGGRALVNAKVKGSHDYKFSAAAFEDAFHVSPAFRSRYLASSVYQLMSSTLPDSAVVGRARAALSG